MLNVLFPKPNNNNEISETPIDKLYKQVIQLTRSLFELKKYELEICLTFQNITKPIAVIRIELYKP